MSDFGKLHDQRLDPPGEVFCRACAEDQSLDMMTCPACEGEGCKACEGEGFVPDPSFDWTEYTGTCSYHLQQAKIAAADDHNDALREEEGR